MSKGIWEKKREGEVSELRCALPCHQSPTTEQHTKIDEAQTYIQHTNLYGLVPGGPASAVRDEHPAQRGHALSMGPPVRGRALTRLVVLPRPVAGKHALLETQLDVSLVIDSRICSAGSKRDIRNSEYIYSTNLPLGRAFQQWKSTPGSLQTGPAIRCQI